jgi:hypothetical protein
LVLFWLPSASGQAVLAAPAGAGDKASLVPPVCLPDGQEFKTWEMPQAYSKTYYVNQARPNAADDNPGSQDRPLRTIGRAAQVLQPGERVVVAAGVYRERVRPARGGGSSQRLISYEAAPGAEVVLSGSRVVASKWSLSNRSTPNRLQGVWMTMLPQEFFARENPFKEVNLTDAQIEHSMLSGGEGRYWVEEDGRTLHVRPLGGIDPAQGKFEVTTRGFIFAPDAFGLGYIRVKGLTIEHAGNRFPRPQQGALSTMRGHHWIIEDCTVRQCNSIGIDIGDQFDTAGPELAQGGQHIVRRNTITDCGIGGVEGPFIQHTLIEDNVIRRCGWQDAWRIYECGGIKVHCTRSCVLRRNLVTDTISAPGIWMDYENVNSRCTSNLIANVQCETGGIFMEASQAPNLVDTNIVWATRGNGIYQHDCDELTIAHNLVAGSTDAAVRMQVCQGRIVGGRLSTAKRNRIVNNIFVDHARPLAISDPENRSDYNVFDTSHAFDLVKWKKSHEWDAHSAAVKLRVQLDVKTLTLTYSADGRLPMCPIEPRVGLDFFAEPRAGIGTPPGPFAALPARPVSLRTSPGR